VPTSTGLSHANRAHLDKLNCEGFVVVEDAVPADLCTAANTEIDKFKIRNRRVVAKNLDEVGRMYRVVNLHLASKAVASVFSDNRALEVCDQFFGAETALYTSLFFERGSQQEVHRDSPLFVTRPEGSYLGVWAALEDTDSENGPLLVVPGSHRLPPLDLHAMASELYGEPSNAPTDDGAGWDTYQGAVRAQASDAGLAPQEVHVKTGDVIIWHPLLLHGGAEQRAPHRTRRSLVMHVTPRGMPVYHQDVFFDSSKDVPLVAPFDYYLHGERSIPASTRVDFAHEYSVSVAHLYCPDDSPRRRLEVTARRMKRRLFD
jgi:phytanoyl-CoA hydroxylase